MDLLVRTQFFKRVALNGDKQAQSDLMKMKLQMEGPRSHQLGPKPKKLISRQLDNRNGLVVGASGRAT